MSATRLAWWGSTGELVGDAAMRILHTHVHMFCYTFNLVMHQLRMSIYSEREQELYSLHLLLVLLYVLTILIITDSFTSLPKETTPLRLPAFIFTYPGHQHMFWKFTRCRWIELNQPFKIQFGCQYIWTKCSQRLRECIHRKLWIKVGIMLRRVFEVKVKPARAVLQQHLIQVIQRSRMTYACHALLRRPASSALLMTEACSALLRKLTSLAWLRGLFSLPRDKDGWVKDWSVVQCKACKGVNHKIADAAFANFPCKYANLVLLVLVVLTIRNQKLLQSSDRLRLTLEYLKRWVEALTPAKAPNFTQ